MPLTRRKINSFRSTISCKNWGAIHLEDAFVLMLTEETGGDCRCTFSKSLDGGKNFGGSGEDPDPLYPF